MEFAQWWWDSWNHWRFALSTQDITISIAPSCFSSSVFEAFFARSWVNVGAGGLGLAGPVAVRFSFTSRKK